MPIRILTVTGTPCGSAAATAACTIAANRSRFHGSAAPPPLRVTLGTGQPKLRSTWSARSSAAMTRTAAPTVAGSTPYTWTERGVSSGSCAMIRSDSGVRSTRARDVTISATYSPAPCSRHSRRKARLVTPAIGARTTGVSMVSGPRRSGGSRSVVVVTPGFSHPVPRAPTRAFHARGGRPTSGPDRGTKESAG